MTREDGDEKGLKKFCPTVRTVALVIVYLKRETIFKLVPRMFSAFFFFFLL
jgi:hypothetical protein